MAPLALPDDAASMYAYTPPPVVEHEASASTLEQPSPASEEWLVKIAFYNAAFKGELVEGERALEICKKADATRQAETAYKARIAELIADAALDGISLNKVSERDFWTFLRAQGFFSKGKLFLLDNGNLRAVWNSEAGDQIGLQFLGNGIIQYVLFKHRSGAENVSRVAGRDTFDGVRRQIIALDLNNLINA